MSGDPVDHESVPAPAHRPLAAEALRRRTDPGDIVPDSEPADDGLVGQARALNAIAFGTEMRRSGFNLFVMGAEGAGRHTAVRRQLARHAATQPPPSDWIYVSNFKVPHRPRAIEMPNGTAARFRDAMQSLLADLAVAIPAMFESDEYKSRRGAFDQEFEEAQEEHFRDLNRHAREKNIAIMRTPVGFAFAPQRDGEVVKPDAFEELAAEEQAAIRQDINELQAELKAILETLPNLEKQRRDRVRALNKEMATRIVTVEVSEVAEAFAGISSIGGFLEELAEDVVANVEIFIETAAAAQSAAMPITGTASDRDPRLRRYSVNVVVGDQETGAGGTGAPVVEETNPTYPNLIGRVEHMSQMGALVTDFTLIKPGALHRANGGFLVIDMRDLATMPGAWIGLKRALNDREIRITTLAEQFSAISTISLEPDPIPLDVKVVLIGDRMFYYLLQAYDPQFSELFKVQADFNDDLDRDGASASAYASLIASIAEKDGLLPLSPDGIARSIDEAARLAADAEKLSLRIGVLADILREADHWARKSGQKTICGADIAKAVTERRSRAGRVPARIQEAIERNIVLIDTDGAAVGQVNGLSVRALGNHAFGSPSRITARVRMGSGKVVDIEREVELGGPLHSKGVLILSGFLSARFARNVPVSLWASLVFEQSYGGVDGDSASSAELYALLSALSAVPIRQSFAVTGSVNQFGQVQAIGGVNEKIEGFFDLCAARGLTGHQGVLIPLANTKHLMLRDDVVEASRDGRFFVHAVETIDQGIEILTGVAAGAATEDGRFPDGTINAKVEATLAGYAAERRRYGLERGSEGNEP